MSLIVAIATLLSVVFAGGCDGTGIETAPLPPAVPTTPPTASPAISPTISKTSEGDMVAVRPAYSRIQGVGSRQTLKLRLWPAGSESVDAAAEAWTSENPEIATVDDEGRVTAVAVGETLIRAVYKGEAALARVIVEAAGLSMPEATPEGPEPAPSETLERPEEEIPPEEPEIPESEESPSPSSEAPFADRIVSYVIGETGGFHEDRLPDVVLGPPKGGGLYGGSLDVFSLGVGGEIVLEFTDYPAFDGEGDDFIVFENAFQVGPDPDDTFAEPGIVGISEDGTTWVEFPCNLDAAPYAGCAGVHPVLANSNTNDIDPTDPAVAGGDAFDLADVGLKKVRFVKIRDSGLGLGPLGPGTSGFDLDAIAIVHGTLP